MTATAAAAAPPGDTSCRVPLDVALVLEILTSGEASTAAANRRKFPRTKHVATASLEPFQPPSAKVTTAPRRTIYTRDANQWGVGFITQERLTTGEDALLRIADPAGTPLAVRCGILRCREVLPGWYEGAVLFTAEEPRLSPEALAAGTAG
jgi:hypothetical protein